MSLTLDDVNDVLSVEIELASESNSDRITLGVFSKHKKLTYCPLTKRFQLYSTGKALWAEGEANVIYAIKCYNDLYV